MRSIVMIPARLASTRLPDKPLADIGGKPMIVRVVERAQAAKVGPVIVAAAEQAIVDAVVAAGGDAVLTDPDLPSGSDRIMQALRRVDPTRVYDTVVNVQGDLPTLDPQTIAATLAALDDAAIATPVAEIVREEERTNPNVVKAVFGANRRALYFTRATAPTGDGPLYHHIGLYVYRRAALERFVSLPPGLLEQRERLEQLRALEDGMPINIAIVDTVPLGVDTPADLERARAWYAARPSTDEAR
ncbi:MAG: 3-deoxy-manno-octulosonate cytidylyltransferase [Alphaproteobacteria bacterium]|nr:3-deoxy-manno-octulosonate cytidylyltransferase [Alphaproteobacteria bacterium]MCB9930500.1 3-deoxy-manno-octulosonate cytidylyltransferase [Alphaproteobacteria bacterium]